MTIIGHLKKHMKKFHTTEASEWKRSTEKENKEMLWFECLSFPPFFEELLNTFYSDLNLVSTAIQRLHLSEFEFLFLVCEYFQPHRVLFKHWTQNVNNHKSGKLQRTTTTLLLSSLLLSSSRTATRLAADVVCLSYSPACLQLHQGLLLPRLMLYPLFSEFGGSSTNLLLVF